MAKNHRYSLGWRPDLPDIRDYQPESDSIEKILGKSEALKAAPKQLPASVDLRSWCSPIEDQGDIGSCTANAGVSLIEYFERLTFGKYLDASRLFLIQSHPYAVRLSGRFRCTTARYLEGTDVIRRAA